MRMKIARVLPLFLVLTLAFAAAGCLVPVEEARVKIALTPEELVEKMVEAIRDVESYQFDMEMTMDMKTVNYGETIETSSLIQSAGQVDRTNQRMMTTMIFEMTMPPMPGVPEEVMEMEIEMYWLDGMMYMKAPMMPGMPPMWTKGEMPWVCSLEQGVDLLKVSQIDILRVEEVNGVESYVIKVVPDLGKLWEIMMTTIIALGMDLDPVAMGIDLEEMFDKITMKTWVCRDTFLPVKDQSQMTMVLEGMEKKMSTISRLHSFNEPVTIQLPAEAAEVEEMPQW
ncbi:hypothetical protein M1N47_04405 [Dehalococcoidia bacterium]|nr:hypothetical protein [Dehalococcoidia bacterium]